MRWAAHSWVKRSDLCPEKPSRRRTALCAGAPCRTRRRSTAATKTDSNQSSKIRCVTKPVADAKRTLSAVQSCLPDHVVHAVHQRPAPCKHRQEDDITPSQTRRGGERSDEQELALEELFKRPSSRHAPTLRRLERDVVSPELGPVEIIAPRRDSSTPTTSSSHSSVMAVVSACTSN